MWKNWIVMGEVMLGRCVSLQYILMWMELNSNGEDKWELNSNGEDNKHISLSIKLIKVNQSYKSIYSS